MTLQPGKPIFNRQSLSRKSQPDPHDAALLRYAASRTPLLFTFSSTRKVEGIIVEVCRFFLIVQVGEKKIIVWKTHLETTEPGGAL